ncbi:Tub_2 domain-containing protein [Cephalotus follicularis]|uniref:Tub_2 domain-containing protein n=1 Tax=Cephalotus follicularis TaxID=3775 RepID=A0A1Q3ASE9_CEPFO|nr:Tub_2 domain-containing protein [Cephalotus follicularis]
MAASAPIFPANVPIPVDLFVSKNHSGIPRGDIRFGDSSDHIVYRVHRESSKSSPLKQKVVFDSTGNPLFSIYRRHGGDWQGFKGDGREEKDLIFRVQRTLKTFNRIELEVFFVGGQDFGDNSKPDLIKVKGCPFQRSCTIYKGDSIVAQTSLMYKLNQIYARRSRFRVTIFPGSIDHALVVAFVVIFFDGRKYWN